MINFFVERCRFIKFVIYLAVLEIKVGLTLCLALLLDLNRPHGCSLLTRTIVIVTFFAVCIHQIKCVLRLGHKIKSGELLRNGRYFFHRAVTSGLRVNIICIEYVGFHGLWVLPRVTLEYASHKLHCKHLALILGVRYALMVLATFKGVLFLVARLLLLDELLDELPSLHFFRFKNVSLFALRLLANG